MDGALEQALMRLNVLQCEMITMEEAEARRAARREEIKGELIAARTAIAEACPCDHMGTWSDPVRVSTLSLAQTRVCPVCGRSERKVIT